MHSPRSKSPTKHVIIAKPKIVKPIVKKKSVRNIFDIIQFKKMIGKSMVKPYVGIVIDKKTMIEEAKKIKDKILEGNIKSIAMTGYINAGVLFIILGVDRLYVINAISYQELKKSNVEIEIVINQYPKLTKDEIIQML
jgi:hypothetical protein